jgi:hypothetical protein
VNRTVGKIAALVLLAVAWNAGAQSRDDVDRARAELHDVEIAYDKGLIVYLSCGGPSDDFDEMVGRQAKIVGVSDFTLTHLAGSEAVPATAFRIARMQIHGRGEFGDVQSLLHRISSLGHSRVLDFESIHLGEVRGRSVSLDGTLAMACYDHDSTAMEFRVPRGRSPEEVELAAYRGRLQQLRAATTAAGELQARMQPRRLVDALLVLADVWGRGAVGVHDLRYTVPALTLQGIVLGEGAKGAVEGSLRDPRFERTQIEWSPAGDCQNFTASARLSALPAAPSDEALPMNMFVERDAKLCNGLPAGACCRAEGGAMASVAKRGSGPLTVHLRNADVSTLFLALNDVSPADGFIVEPDVTGRLNVDFDDVTMGEALDALRAAGVAFATPGPLHRICRTACGQPTVKPQKYDGEPLSFSIVEGGVTDILRAFEEVSGLQLHVPRDLKGNVAIYVTEAPWDAVFDSLIAAFDRTYTIDGTRVYIGDRAAAVPLGKLLSTPVTLSPRSLVERDPKRIAAADFRLAGIAGNVGTNGGTWKAYGRVLGSPKFVFVAAPGASLLDASVTAVAADRVTLHTTGGQDVVVALP